VTQGAGIPDRSEQSYLGRMIDEDGIRRRWEAIGSKLDERAQRMFAAAEVRTAGWGGLKAVANHGARPLDDQPRRGRSRR